MKLSNDPNPKDVRLEEDDWIAECRSLQPDRSIQFSCIGSSWDALCLIYLLSHVADLPWFTDDITRRIAQKAYASNYEGGWETVQEVLELNPQTPEQFYEWFLLSRSPEEFFGNLRKRARRLLKLLRFKKRDPHGPVRKVNRPRGYRDKGTLRPPHRPPVVPPGEGPKSDRRHLVGHPLLYDKERTRTEGETSASQSPKGG